MGRSLKDKNRPALAAVLILNAVLFYAALKTNSIFTDRWYEAFTDWQKMVPTVFASLVAGLLNSLLSPNTKAQIIFLRKRHPLPGSRAFSYYASADHRINLQQLKDQLGPLPSDPGDQNKVWYRLYKTVETEPSVETAQREFLFYRDYGCFSLLALVLLGPLAFILIPSPDTAVLIYVVLLFQLVLTHVAAKNAASRFVTNVLASAPHKSSNANP